VVALMRPVFKLAVLVLATVMVAGAHPPDDALYARTASQVLRREFSSADISYLLLDVRSGSVIASRWDANDKPIAIGSLLKPFAAIAYAEAHRFAFPQHTCRGGGECWYPRGHGKVGFVRALAFSCNSYFRQLAADVSAAQVNAAARRFGLNGPAAGANPEALIGMNGAWRESPRALLLAYAELLGRRSQPAIRDIVEGMSAAARDGTASALAHEAPRLALLAKTGTAPCTHLPHAPGDGFVIVAWPADAPHYLLLVRRHGTPGSQAAIVAGRMVRLLEPQS
jgi:cell division protein FtsI/penicillin-binding protein 2